MNAIEKIVGMIISMWVMVVVLLLGIAPFVAVACALHWWWN